MTDRLLRRKEVEARIGFARSTLYKWLAEGSFPRPIYLGSAPRWSEKEIRAWIDARLNQRSEPTKAA